MVKMKFFQSKYGWELNIGINKWLEKNKDIEIINTNIVKDSFVEAFIFYKERD